MNFSAHIILYSKADDQSWLVIDLFIMSLHIFFGEENAFSLQQENLGSVSEKYFSLLGYENIRTEYLEKFWNLHS